MSEQQPGQPQQLSPLVARLLANNASPYTYTGTQTYLVGQGALAVIDPGPEDARHLDAILGAVAGRRVAAIVCTHTHRDHSPLARPLAAATGAPVIGCAPLVLEGLDERADAAFDRDYAADRVLADGETLAGEGWTLTAVATPGHTSNHLCFALPEEGALFSGDHVMGWSTTVIAPPDGHMGQFMASLDKLGGRDDRIYYPAHGDPVDKPQRLVRSQAGHRRQREAQVLRLVTGGVAEVGAMVAEMYRGLDPRLVGAAKLSVWAHLIDLEERGQVRHEGRRWTAA